MVRHYNIIENETSIMLIRNICHRLFNCYSRLIQHHLSVHNFTKQTQPFLNNDGNEIVRGS